MEFVWHDTVNRPWCFHVGLCAMLHFQYHQPLDVSPYRLGRDAAVQDHTDPSRQDGRQRLTVILSMYGAVPVDAILTVLVPLFRRTVLDNLRGPSPSTGSFIAASLLR